MIGRIKLLFLYYMKYLRHIEIILKYKLVNNRRFDKGNIVFVILIIELVKKFNKKLQEKLLKAENLEGSLSNFYSIITQIMIISFIYNI
jgi:hypothetical protein